MNHQYARLYSFASTQASSVITNDDLAQMMDTSDEWIQARTGIAQRCWVKNPEELVDMAVTAAKKSLDMANVSIHDVDVIIVATSSYHRTWPSMASSIQGALGGQCMAFDVNAACSGFIYITHIARSFIESGQHKRVLLIAADAGSQVIDRTDRRTAVIFGDGAGAALMEAADKPGILYSACYSNGQDAELLVAQNVDGKPVVTMDGRRVFKNAVSCFDAIAQEVASATGISIEDVNCVIPHQANQRILSSIQRNHAIPDDKMVSIIAQYGNTVAASIPMALAHASQQSFKEGDLVLLKSFGAGTTWGCVLFKAI